MKIYLKVYGYLQRYTEAGEDWVEIEADSTDLQDLLKQEGIPVGEVSFLVRNGAFMDWDDELQEGDHIECIPPIEGG